MIIESSTSSKMEDLIHHLCNTYNITENEALYLALDFIYSGKFYFQKKQKNPKNKIIKTRF